MTDDVQGLIPILATPFAPDGSVDLPSLRRLAEFQLASGAAGVAVSGMASETFALTTAERSEILSEVVAVVAGAGPVVAGVNATSTVTAVEQARAAQEGGAGCLMVLPPYMVKPANDQLVDFYGEVAAAVELPIMIQDAPGATGVTMSPAMLDQLAKIDGVRSVKVEAPPTARKVAAVSAALADAGVTVLGGQNAQFCLEEYARGAVGTMPACEFTDLLAPILRDWETGSRQEARRAFALLLPLIAFGLQQGIAWAVHKHVLRRRGLIAHDGVRLPARPLDATDRASLDALLAELGIG